MVALRPIRRRPSFAMATPRRLPSSAASPDPVDNTKLCPDRWASQRTRVFTELQSHLFEDRFGRPGKGNRKVEGLVGFIRGTSWSPCHLNDALAEQCRRQGGAAAGPQGDHRRSSRAGSSTAILLPMMPAIRWTGEIACVAGALPQQRLFRPVAATVRCSPTSMRWCSCGADVIARQPSYDSEDLIFDPLHYLPLDRAEDRRPGRGRAIGGLEYSPIIAAIRLVCVAGKREYMVLRWRTRRSVQGFDALPPIGFDATMAVPHGACGSTSSSVSPAPGSR